MNAPRSAELALDRGLSGVSDDAALVAELKAGSEDAFAYLLDVYQNPIYNLVLHIVENGTDAADVLQETFINVFEGIKGFRGGSSLKTWIYRVAVHAALNHRRGWLRRHRRETVSLDDDHGGPGVLISAGPADTETPYEALELSERQELLRRALRSLAQPYRAVVVLREMEGMSYEEIAQVLGVSEGTVKSRLVRGRDLLRRKLTSLLAR